MIRFLHPEVFLLGLVVVVALRKHFVHGRLVTVLRALILLLVLGALAEPWRVGASSGRDLILLVDRSRSVPPGALDALKEHADLAVAHAEPGDRIGVVLFGRTAVVEQAPTEGYRYRAPTATVDPDGTDLAAGLEAALALIPPGRQGSILVLSDGEQTGRDPGPAARRARRRGVRIDAAPLRREGVLDVAIEEVAAPEEVAVGEPYQVSVWVRSDRPVEAPFRILRDGQLIAEGRRTFRRGVDRIQFRDRIVEPGVHRYTVRLALEDDRVAENNEAQGAVRVTGPFRVLCVTPGGRDDRLTRSLASAGLAVSVVAPEAAPLDLDTLDGVRAVVLEDVALEDLPRGSAQALRSYVRDLGGGLLMTGGGASFGQGGYYRSPVEDVLPVSMEIREEERKFALAMAIALDRSGSMAAPVPGGGTKMDLANLGAVAAIELLSRRDLVSVIAVDSAAHLVVPLTPVQDKAGIIAQVRTIESMGGGIFTYTALQAAASQLRGAAPGTKHIVIFADAADAEEPGDYKTFVPKLRAAGVTVSVIGLGKPSDPDGPFLEDLAALGGGRCFFGEDPSDLPRMFAQETIQVARSSLAEEPTAVDVLPDIVSVGMLHGAAFPDVDGYSIAYLKPGAQRGLVTSDETAAPLLAFWQAELGRSAAFLGMADGRLSGALSTWEGYADFFATLVRWVAGTDATRDLFAEVTRQGHEAVVGVEVEPGREDLLGGIEARLVGPDDASRAVVLARVGETRLEARISLPQEGAYRPVLTTGDGRVLRLPAVMLPYSPEYEPRLLPDEGERTLRDVVRSAEGRIDPPASELMVGSRASVGTTPLGRWFAWAALGLLLLEIFVRRIRPRLPALAGLRPVRAVRAAWRTWRTPAPGKADAPKAVAAYEAVAGDEPTPEPAAPAPPSAEGIAGALARAKRKRR
ncbi:MAG: VWA domain-containing protein [Planctomycetota bacterium]